MEWIGYLIFALIMLGFMAVIIHFIREKMKGHSILADEPHLSSKSLVKLYKIRKKSEEKKKEKESKNSL